MASSELRRMEASDEILHPRKAGWGTVADQLLTGVQLWWSLLQNAPRGNERLVLEKNRLFLILAAEMKIPYPQEEMFL